MKKVKRKYDSGHRRALAEHTRERILMSARRLFSDQAYGRTTIEEIASAAGVAAPTVYATFGSKRAIFLTLLDEIEKGADAASLVTALEENDQNARGQARAFVDFSVRLFTRGADVVKIARLAGPADPDAAALWKLGSARRLDTCRGIARRWARQGALHAGVSEDFATDVLWSFCGPEMYALFVDERGWSPEQFGDWLYSVLVEQVLGPPTRDEKRRGGA